VKKIAGRFFALVLLVAGADFLFVERSFIDYSTVAHLFAEDFVGHSVEAD
jgi:hypothetical protein